MDESRYRAFISYSHGDKRWAEWLHRALEAYAPPRHLVGRRTAAGEVPRRFAPVFRDRDELPSASSLGKQVEDALRRSDNLVVICSPSAARSPWVNAEVLGYKRLGNSERIFCLIVEGEPGASAMPGREAEECFPPGVRFELGADGNIDVSRPVEPIAADARPHGDGRENARLKLLAGMLDLGFDDLKQRELTRRHRRITAIASLALLLAAVMAVLGVQAMIARQAAEVARQAAERRQKQAEGLIGFMLGDLDAKLREVDRLDILADVADKAMEYFRSLPNDDLSGVGMAQRVTALQKIGSVRASQGNAAAALEAFEAARAISRSLARQSPGDASRQAAYAESLSWVGKTHWQQGQADEAAAAFSRAADVLESAVKLAPDSVPLLKAVVSEATNNGRVLETAGKLDDAERNYREVLDAAERWRALQPGDREAQKEVGYASNNLGVLAARRGELRAALRFYRQDLAIKQALSDAAPRDNAARADVALALMFTAKLQGQLGELARAIADVQRAAEIYGELLRFDPTQVATTLPRQGLAYRGLAGFLLDAGRGPESAAPAARALQAFERARTADPTNPYLLLRYWEARLLMARASLSRGAHDAARNQALQAEAGLAAFDAGEAGRQDQARLRARALMVAADAVKRVDPRQARANYLGARGLLAPYVTDATRDPDLLDPWLRLAAEIGTRPFPQRNLESLRSSGYANPDFMQAMARAGVAYPPPGQQADAALH